MRTRTKRLKIWTMILGCVLCFGFLPRNIKATTGNVYSCEIARTYEHPVTGKIEDSGGSSSKTTGQGMVEGVIASKGLLEVTDSGEYYLTFKMSLIDQTSKYSFWVQKRGASGFQAQSVTEIGTGKDNNGTTKDYRIKLPAQDSIVRCSMYVEPMGRNVIFYFYPGNYTVGNSVGMKAKIVTDASDHTKSEGQTATEETTAQEEVTTQTQETTKTEDETLNNAQGLSLSNAPKTTTKKKTSSEKSVGTWIMIITISITISGLILLGVAAAIVYYYRKNWEKWGGDLDEYDEIYKEEN